jgi:hypothetical protein
MGSKKEEQKQRTFQKKPEERAFEQWVRDQAMKYGDQLTLGDLASTGGDFRITEDMEALVNQAVGGQADVAKRNLLASQADQERLLRANLAKRGQTDSSYEGISQATLGQETLRQLANIESQRMSGGAEALINLSNQGVQSRLSANQQLLAALTGMAPASMGIANQFALGNFTTRAETKDPWGTAASFVPDIGIG